MWMQLEATTGVGVQTVLEAELEDDSWGQSLRPAHGGGA
jgi:hypothetical protein